MALTYKKGDTVEVVQAPIYGTIEKAEICGDDVMYLVNVEINGEQHQRLVKEDDLAAKA